MWTEALRNAVRRERGMRVMHFGIGWKSGTIFLFESL
jgi:hypothetical protein